MTKNLRVLLAICLIAIAGVIVLQYAWIRSYYKTTRFNFEREVNMVFEDAVKKEFQLRCDTIERLLVLQLMDTSAFRIHSKYNASLKTMVQVITNAKNNKDQTSFSTSELPDSLRAEDTAYRRKIALRYAKNLRSEDLEKHIVYYRTQNLGEFLNEKVRRYGFDTSRLRTVLSQYLLQHHIRSSFHFYTSKNDSTVHYASLPDSLSGKGVVITRSSPTYKWWSPEEQYVRAVFPNPVGYVLSQMKWILGGALLLILLVAWCIGMLIIALLREKRLSLIKNDFISNITHELKTPVATISAAIESLQGNNLEKEKSDRYLSHARNGTEKLSMLIDHILDISFYEKNSIAVHPEKIMISNAIQTIADDFITTSGKPVSYKYSGDPDNDALIADRQLFMQAVCNVIDNAIKYSGDTADLWVRCYKDDQYIHIAFTDKGMGIDAQSLPHVFEKFYREPRKEHAVKGYGLGLNYVQAILKAHNGKVAVISTKGKGTTVTLSWPLQ
ncbi:sensor histidine kinase [Sediminibacterium ginsengisoli]|uniref:histidine kinase n=1 Tax=Sediminibacterium ginsengisoli TaxID=413434 RepID=A0A1T4M0M8_9BACT|nr:HAMP domain-containing sensor histidine kinase [Sediminibacterium ginsengisoli]SJZ60472.1 His Kinase A (phospho-acceptor) domain-containing protein [Sediminibacterium ginsengisoli]